MPRLVGFITGCGCCGSRELVHGSIGIVLKNNKIVRMYLCARCFERAESNISKDKNGNYSITDFEREFAGRNIEKMQILLNGEEVDLGELIEAEK